MKLTLNLRPMEMFRLREILEDKAEETATWLDRNSEYVTSGDTWKLESFAKTKAEDVEVHELLTALYEALNKSETMNG